MCSELGELVAAVESLPRPSRSLGGNLAETTVALRLLIERTQVAYLRHLAVLEAGGGLIDGATPLTYVMRGSNLPARTMRDESRLADSLHTDTERRCAATAELLDRGELTVAQASVITRTMPSLPAEDVALLEATVAQACAETHPSATDRICQHTKLVAGEDRALAREDRVHQRRHLHLSSCGDIVRIDGELPARDGATVLAAIDALATPMGANDPRSTAQRTADALVELARRNLAGGALPVSGGLPPHLHLTVDVRDLLERAGTASLSGRGAAALTWSTARQLACDSMLNITALRNTSGPRFGKPPNQSESEPAAGEVDPDVLRRLLATVSPALGGFAPEVIAVGRSQRLVTVAQRRALVARDKGCGYPGYDRPPEWTNAHHLVHWADGGRTDLANLVLVCVHHHTVLHRTNSTLERAPNGAYIVRADGPPSREAVA